MMPHPTTRTVWPSRYAPLVAYIAACPSAPVRLTFAEIEAILGRPLAVSAQVAPHFWRDAHTQRFVADLRALGWEAHLDIRGRAVEFRRPGG
jgi:hypothetical protein